MSFSIFVPSWVRRAAAWRLPGVVPASRFIQRLPAGDPLRDKRFRRLWASSLVGGLGLQLMVIGLPLTAAVLLDATPWQMGLLVACETLPMALLALPSGVWLDRVRRLPVFLAGELLLALAALSVPLAWWAGWLGMGWLYAVGLVIGTVHTVAFTAGQIVMALIVAREQLVQAHARNAIATSGAELAGPGVAGLLIKALGAPLAMGVNGLVLLLSAGILRGLRLNEPAPPRAGRWWPELRAGLAFVAGQRLLVALAVAMGVWQLGYHMVLVVQVLYATRTIGLADGVVALCFGGVGAGTVVAGVVSQAIARQVGPGRAMAVGAGVTALGWLSMPLLPAGPWGVAGFVGALVAYGLGAGVLFIGFFALRQAVTPLPLLGRMTSVMRWLTLLPGAPGALLGGWVADTMGLRPALAVAGGLALTAALLAWCWPVLRRLRELPQPAAAAAPMT